LKGFDPKEKPGSRSERIETADAVEGFLAAAASISRKTWQHQSIGQRIKTDAGECERLRHLADNGLLRCYVLYYGETPCAFCIGYQFGDVYYADEVGFDPSLSDVSPGTALFLKIIQDLLVHRRANLFNFGTGDAPYKHLFSNETYLDATMLVTPATLRNRIVVGCHAQLQRLRERMKAKAATREEDSD
jgi:CelD/BcsL family acetyltransferase involved in cellulose biosynthesis